MTNESGFVISISIVLCTFMLGWVIFGIKWAIKSANNMSKYTPVK